MTTDVSSDPGLLVLISLAGGAKHGHAMLLDIESLTARRLGPGTLYGAIGRLEDEGLIEPTPGDGRRRPYCLTTKGRDRLTERIERLSVAVHAARERLAAS